MSDEDEKRQVVETLRQLRDAERDHEIGGRAPSDVLPTPKPVRAPDRPEIGAQPSPPLEPGLPDNRAVNERWDLGRTSLPDGWRGWLARALRPVLQPFIAAQVEFNSRQVQLDNQLLEYLSARFDVTHRHYDAVLGSHGERMNDIDQRHVELQEELVAHVHDLVQRIDLVLGDGERNRVALEAALRDVRQRLAALEGAHRKS